MAVFLVDDKSIDCFLRHSRSLDDKFSALWRLCKFDDLLDISEDGDDLLSPINRVRLCFLRRDYFRPLSILKEEALGNNFAEACSLHSILILIYFPKKFSEKVGVLRDIANDDSLLKVLEYYYHGNVKDAERYRLMRDGSCHNQLARLSKKELEIPSSLKKIN